ncbi:MAG TPA: YraN family protein [Phycisphaerales bacterium]|nr:YraN family protein [Phycisphaerales bacterium]
MTPTKPGVKSRAGALLGRLIPGGAGAKHLRLGRRGERLAAARLRRSGYRILARNLDTPGGEADIVCLHRASGAAVLVEVKTRVRAEGDRSPATTAAIHADKRRRLARTARSLAAHPLLAGRAVRIDVITVEFRDARDRRPEIRHYVNAVTGDGRLR